MAQRALISAGLSTHLVELDALRSGRPGTSEEYLDVYHWLCEELGEDAVQNPGPFLVFDHSTHSQIKRAAAPPRTSRPPQITANYPIGRS